MLCHSSQIKTKFGRISLHLFSEVLTNHHQNYFQKQPPEEFHKKDVLRNFALGL